MIVVTNMNLLRAGFASLLILSGITALTAQEAQSPPEPRRPNIVLIMADDLGFGDVQRLNPDSKLPTPHLDRLAGQGMSFVDAHSPSAVCTPTRYGLLTGRYCWRSQLKRGVLGGYSPPLIEVERSTLAMELRRHGYATACVGKWHLGMELPMRGEGASDREKWIGDPGVDFEGKILDGPTTHGFDYFLGVTASLDMPPYVLVENDRFVSQPTLQQPSVGFPGYVRAGPRSADFVMDEILDRLADKAVELIARQEKNKQPLFLYVPLTAPHKPALPEDRFRGRSGLGPYGDFVMQVDATVGRILTAIDDAHLSDNTLVIFTSDNGSYMFRRDDPQQRDHVDDETIQAFRSDRHRSNGPFRGTKADIWEAGHHVPFFVRFPGQVPPESECREPICLTDVYATCLDLLGYEVPTQAAEDSYSLVPLFTDPQGRRGAPVIHHSVAGMFAIRDGNWKLVLGNGSGGREKPAGKPFQQPYTLFDLAVDPGETKDLAADRPDVVKQLVKRFEDYVGTDALQP